MRWGERRFIVYSKVNVIGFSILAGSDKLRSNIYSTLSLFPQFLYTDDPCCTNNLVAFAV